MLKQRLITAIILIPLFIALVLKLSPQAFCILTALLTLWGAWEWSNFLGVKRLPQKLGYLFLVFLSLYATFFVPIPLILYVAVLFWLLALILVIRYPKASPVWGKGVVLRGLMGIVVLIPCWLALNSIRNVPNGTYTLLFLFVLIWGADSGAYFSGRFWGKHKMAPAVSPGKTWEGLLGALITTVIIVLISLMIFKVSYMLWPAVFVLSLLTVLFSVLGDLFESMLKRREGLKDSGRLLPGHGGILDRIDSLTAAAPIFALGLSVLWQLFTLGS